jgi:hypothetical protein
MCTQKLLLAAEEDFGNVSECDCGTVHVTVGPVSVALSAHALRRLEGLLAAALQRLSSSSEDDALSNEHLGHEPRVH